MSVAVLAFDVLSRDSADALTADGFHAELIVSLGKVGTLDVRTRGQIQRYHAADGSDPIAAGRALNAAYVVSGTWRRSGDRVRITAEMARSTDGAQVWTDAFERSSTDLMGLEVELATAAASAIVGRLRPRDRAALARQPTRVNAAWEQYVRGNALMAQRETGGLPGATAAYRVAVSLDPGFAAAWGRLAEALALTSSYADVTPADVDSLARLARQAADRAVQLDSTSAEAWLARGVAMNVADYRGRQAAFARTASLDSTSVEAHYLLGTNLRFFSADQATAERHLRIAHQLDPTYTNPVRWLATLLWYQGRTFEALAYFDSLRAMAPSLAHGAFWANSYIDLQIRAGNSSGARAELADLLGGGRQIDSAWALAVASRVAANLGDTTAARRYLSAATADPRAMQRATADEAIHVISAHAAAWAALGETGRALDLLESRRGDGVVLWAELRAPYFASLAPEPRFARLLESVWPR